MDFDINARIEQFGKTGNGFELTMDKADLLQLLRDFQVAITPERIDLQLSARVHALGRNQAIDEIEARSNKILEGK